MENITSSRQNVENITVVFDAVEFEKQNLEISSLDQKQIISCFFSNLQREINLPDLCSQYPAPLMPTELCIGQDLDF